MTKTIVIIREIWKTKIIIQKKIIKIEYKSF